MSLQEAKQQIEEAKKQAQEQRKMLEERRTEAKQKEIEIGEQKSKLPIPSQRLLRSGMFTGLEGRKRRQLVSKAKGQLEAGEQEISKFKTRLGEFEEKELKPFEEDIQKREGEIKDYEEKLQAIALIEKYAGSDKEYILGWVAKSGEGYAREYASKYLEGVQLDRMKEALSQQSFSSESTSPSIQLSFFSKPIFLEGKLVGYEDPIQKISVGVHHVLQVPKFTFSVPRDLPITDLKKDFSPMSSFKSPNILNVLNKPFITTGSPIRITPLISSSPLRPPTSSKPYKNNRFVMSKPNYGKVSKVLSKEINKKESNIFGTPKRVSVKSKKRKSFWGI